jgi:hypothetical protein
MTTLVDHSGRTIRLTRERLEHILLHPEMAELEAEIAESLRQPRARRPVAIRSRSVTVLSTLSHHPRRGTSISVWRSGSGRPMRSW